MTNFKNDPVGIPGIRGPKKGQSFLDAVTEQLFYLQKTNILLEKKIKRLEGEIYIMDKKELIVFTNNGQTYVFHGVTNFKPTTTGFSFTYTGKATGVTRSTTFNNTSTAGYALTDDTEEA